MKVSRLDHLVLTVKDIAATVAFYTQVLGMSEVVFANGRRALHFGVQKINLHEVGHEFEPKAATPLSGSADLCLITADGMGDVVAHLSSQAVPIELGPIARTGAVGVIESVYVRDPDENLIEIGVYER